MCERERERQREKEQCVCCVRVCEINFPNRDGETILASIIHKIEKKIIFPQIVYTTIKRKTDDGTINSSEDYNECNLWLLIPADVVAAVWISSWHH